MLSEAKSGWLCSAAGEGGVLLRCNLPGGNEEWRPQRVVKLSSSAANWKLVFALTLLRRTLAHPRHSRSLTLHNNGINTNMTVIIVTAAFRGVKGGSVQ